MVSSIIRLQSMLMLSATVMVLFVVATIFIAPKEPTTIDPSEGNITCYRAAVLDHSHPAIKNSDSTWQVFIKASEIAKTNDVKLMVFPESALHQSKNDIEEIPFTYPTKMCHNENDYKLSNVTPAVRFACLAKNKQMYIVGQLLDKQPCHVYDNDTKCPETGYFIFNTAVMFNPKGELILKYHKIQPYGEMSVHPGNPEKEMQVADTELGRFALQICFDLIFNKPGHQLAYEHKVDSVLFPTNWFNEAPFLAASSIQLAWALGNKVNLLASNMHHPMHGGVGSGLYSGNPTKPYFLNANFANDTGLSRLVIMDLPTRPSKFGDRCANNRFEKIVPVEVMDDNKETIKAKSSKYAYKQMNSSGIDFIPLKPTNSVHFMHSTNGIANCSFEFGADFSRFDQKKYGYFLMTSVRMRANPAYTWGEEICAVTFAKINANGDFDRYQTTNISVFHWAKLEATFSADTVVLPSIVGHRHQPISMDEWSFKESIEVINGETMKRFIIEYKNPEMKQFHPLSIMSAFGRVYGADPVYKQVPPSGETKPEPED